MAENLDQLNLQCIVKDQNTLIEQSHYKVSLQQSCSNMHTQVNIRAYYIEHIAIMDFLSNAQKHSYNG